MNKLIFSSGILLLAAMLLTSCGPGEGGGGLTDYDSDYDYPRDTSGREVVKDFQFVSLSSSSVGLRWRAATSPEVTGYQVKWRAIDNRDDTGSVVVNGLSATINELSLVPYNFYVYSIIDGKIYDSRYVVGVWAPAERLTTDGGASPSIRIYEPDSEYGSGLIVDPNREGLRRVRIEPEAGAQFALTIDNSVSPTQGIFGAAWCNPENQLEGRSDPEVYLFETFYSASSLDGWYVAAETDLHSLLYFATQRCQQLPLSLIGSSGGPQGMGFFVRLGDRDSAGRHFVRILIRPGTNGKLLQGVAPNRYVEVEVSYGGGNMPYA